MKDIARRQVVSLCYFNLPVRLSFTFHELIAIQPHLYSRSGVDDVVDTVMKRMKTAEERRIASVDDGIRIQPRDVAPPKRDAAIIIQSVHIDDTALFCPLREIFVLQAQKFFRYGHRRAYIAERAEKVRLLFFRKGRNRFAALRTENLLQSVENFVLLS